MSLLIANDNNPEHSGELFAFRGSAPYGDSLPGNPANTLGDNVGYAAARQDFARSAIISQRSEPIPEPAAIRAAKTNAHAQKRPSGQVWPIFGAASFCAALLAIALHFALGGFDPLLSCAAMTGWSLSGLALGITGRLHFRSIISTIGFSAALAGLLGSVYFACIGMNIIPAPHVILWGSAAATLALWRILDEPFFLLVSGLVAAGLCYLCLMKAGQLDGFWALPAYLALIGVGAARAKFGLVLGLCAAAAWAVIIYLSYVQIANGAVSASLAASAILALAGLQYVIGKLHMDAGRYGGQFHVLCGWAAGLAAAYIVQSNWLGTQSDLLSSLSLPLSGGASAAWLFKGIALCAAGLASGLLAARLIRGRATTLLTLSALVCCSALPVLTIYPDIVLQLWLHTGLSAVPNIGLLIGAVICSAAASALVLGAARNILPLSLIGLAGLGGQAVVLWGFVAGNENALLSFVYPALVCLLIAAMAGSSPRNKPVHRTL